MFHSFSKRLKNRSFEIAWSNRLESTMSCLQLLRVSYGLLICSNLIIN